MVNSKDGHNMAQRWKPEKEDDSNKDISTGVPNRIFSSVQSKRVLTS